VGRRQAQRTTAPQSLKVSVGDQVLLKEVAGTTSARRQRNSCLLSKGHPGDRSLNLVPVAPFAVSRLPISSSETEFLAKRIMLNENAEALEKASTSWLKRGCPPSAQGRNVVLEKPIRAPRSS